MKQYISLLFILFLIVLQGFSQAEYPQNYFGSPLDIPLFLSGNFGELRPEHFHAGIDIKTESKEGKNIYASADGYISRIKFSPWGYGKALYITHPLADGYITVYTHLQKFNEHIDSYVKKAQYKMKRYNIDLYPLRNQFPVKKGELIAISGNSGSSTGPHLHFEIRDAKTDNPLNPLLFNFDIKDNLKPKIYSISIYPQDKYSFTDNKNQTQIFKVYPVAKRTGVSGSNENYSLLSDKIITLCGKIGFGIETHDFLNGSDNICGVYSIELLIDSIRIYYHEFKEFSFSETRYINSHIDYKENIKQKKKIHKTFIAPNNKLSIYKNVENRGIFIFNDAQFHNISFIVKDVYNNTSVLNFKVQSHRMTPSHPMTPKEKADSTEVETKHASSLHSASSLQTKIMPYQTANYFSNDSIEIFIPENALYDTLFFQYSKSESENGCFSSVHHIHNRFTPIHKKYTLSIKTDSIPDGLKNKALIAGVNNKGRFSAVGGTWKDGFVTVKTYKFGNFVVVIDTILPTIKPLNISNDADLSNSTKIDFIIKDNLSGIKSYSGYIDNKWCLLEYDAKNDLITYYFDDERIKKQKFHQLVLTVTDKKENKAVYNARFYW